MFRIANMDENSDLARYLSPIVTNTVLTALEQWTESDYEIETIFDYYFSEGSPFLKQPFFYRISEYIPLNRNKGKVISISGRKRMADDDAVGKEILSRKFQRMKEKLRDEEHYYTFDLFEEYLFALLIDSMESFEMMKEPGPDHLDEDGWEVSPDSDSFAGVEDLVLTKEEEGVAETLKERFGMPDEVARVTSFQIHRIHEFPYYEEEDEFYNDEWTGEETDEELEQRLKGRLENLFFWDEDYAFIFEDGFVFGIQLLVSGVCGQLGYDYEEIAAIFTDIGMAVPIKLIGTKAGLEVRNEAASERFAELMKESPINTDFLEISGPDDDKLPFD